jgi:hypothetical protein
MSVDKRGLDDAVRRYRHVDAIHGDPAETLRFIVDASERADEDELAWIAVLLIDPLLDRHWHVVAGEFEAAMKQSRKLRMAYSCTMIDVPDELDSRLSALVGPDEDVGRQSRDLAAPDRAGWGPGGDELV